MPAALLRITPLCQGPPSLREKTSSSLNFSRHGHRVVTFKHRSVVTLLWCAHGPALGLPLGRPSAPGPDFFQLRYQIDATLRLLSTCTCPRTSSFMNILSGVVKVDLPVGASEEVKLLFEGSVGHDDFFRTGGV